MKFFAFLCRLAAVALATETNLGQKSLAADNPIRRIVTMLQAMQAKVEEEGKRDEATHEKYMCYCKSDRLEKEVAAAEAKIPQLESTIKEGGAALEKLEADIEQHKKDRAAAETNINEVTAIREKEHAEYQKEFDENTKNLAAMEKAIAALEKGMKGFLQTSSAAIVQRLSIDMDMNPDQREQLAAFFSQKQEAGYTPASGDIVGILKTMKDDMEKEFADIKKAEKEAVASFENLVDSKNKEIAALTEALTEKQTRLGDSGVEVQAAKEELGDLKASLESDKDFLANKDKNCATAEKDYEVVKKTRSEELLALSMTIKMLNDDDALEIFKKTLPSASLIQLAVTSAQVKRRALEALKGARRHGDPRIDLIALALHGKKVNFDKVLTMIDDMMKLLKKEQYDDDLRQEICHEELDEAEDKLKATEEKIKNYEKAIKVDKAAIEQAEEDEGELKSGLKKLDSDVENAGETRKEEHADYVATLSENKAAKELLLMAKNRLMKFYNPTLSKEEPKKELSEQERIAQNLGGSSFIQIHDHAQEDLQLEGRPHPVGAYTSKKKEGTGVIEMIDMIITDLDKEIVEQETAEKDAQADYEAFMANSKDKAAKDARMLAMKKKMEADLKVELQMLRAKDKAKLREAYATTGVLGDLHQDCDWLLLNFDTRKEARTAEIDSLNKAKAVLSGMD
jgi:outer membrane murein-binding lipoprotein Lpp